MPASVAKYRLGPFILASELALPELTRRDADLAADVTIRFGKVPEQLEGVVANETRWWASREAYLLRVPGVAAFYAWRGREVVVEPEPGALEGDIRAYLLAPIFSVLCHQLGMYALHASSVRVGEGVVAFPADSGGGKSTLAAYLDRRGYAVISDDNCLLELGPEMPGSSDEPTRVVPVAPALKLWRSALEQLGTPPEELVQVFSKEDKYRFRINEIEDRLPLREVIFIEWTDGPDDPITLIPLAGVQAVGRLMQFTHYDYLMKAMDRQAENFVLCGRILSQVGAYVLRRPRNFARIGEVIDLLEEHFRVVNS
jgi:hypothetical protein